jgi:LSD1 subclass zinc finger protein
MPVQMICPSLKCRKILSVPDDVRGKLVKCQHCQTMFRVPEARKVGAGSGALPSTK